MMSDINLNEIRDVMVSVAYEAGRMMLNADIYAIDPDTKLNCPADIVTDTDKAVEKLVSTRLAERYPSFSFMGEETYAPGDRVTDRPTFVCDPIDGTTNFIHGFPWACISLGLAVDRRPVVGVVYNPWADQLYSAIRGGGAFLRSPIRTCDPARLSGEIARDATHHTRQLPLSRPSPPPPLGDLSRCLVVVEYGSVRDDANFRTKLDTFRRLGQGPRGGPAGNAMAQGIRSCGSAALNVCGVAAGTLDVYWEGGCWAWDVCAGWAILNEAGGLMASANPGNWDPELDSRMYLAVRASEGGKGQKELVEEFWTCMGEGRMKY